MDYSILRNRRSVRSYKKESIQGDLLNDILLDGCRASTTGNMQLYSVILTQKQDMKEKLAPAHFNQRMIADAPVVITVCADFNRFIQWCDLNDANHGYDNVLSFTTAAIDALLVAQTICISAEARGLGICYLGTTIYNADSIIKTLNLPKFVVPITTITMGWPNDDVEQVDRLPLHAIVHNEEYTQFSDEDIRSIYADKENLKSNLKFIEENKKQTLAQVFTDVRYKKADNEFFSGKLIEVLKRQGFLS